MTLTDAIHAAAQQLPPGSEITIVIERDAATVYASDWDGNVRAFDAADMSLQDQVTDCIGWCKAQEPAAPAQKEALEAST